jgi:hypothetical protein
MAGAEGKISTMKRAKHEWVPADLLHHLQTHPMHALGRPEIICPECERLGPIKPVVCLEDGCGRMGLQQVAAHVRAIHHLSIAAYKRKWDYKRRESLTSPAFHKRRSTLSSTAETLRRLRPFVPSSNWRPTTKTSPGARAVPKESTIQRWPIVKQCLEGRERRHIAVELDLWVNSVNRCCQRLHFPSKPARFWRGERVSDRQLHDLMKNFKLTEIKIAELTKLPVHRIRRALATKRKGKALQIDVADRVLELQRQLSAEQRRRSATPAGGAPSKLTASEVREIPWKFRILVKEITALDAELPDTASAIAVDKVGELLCQLARKKKISLLLFWARPFLDWFDRQHGMNRKALSPPAEAARDFLAWEYQVSEETIGKLLAKKPADAADTKDRKRRELLVDMRTLMGARPRVATEELLAGLPKIRWRWEKLNAYSLAALLRPLEVKPLEWRDGSRVVRGYRRQDMGVYSAVEAAREFGITLQGLKKWISIGKIPIPPTVSRAGVRGRGSVRLWTMADIQVAKVAISAQSRTVFRPPASATAALRMDSV